MKMIIHQSTKNMPRKITLQSKKIILPLRKKKIHKYWLRTKTRRMSKTLKWPKLRIRKRSLSKMKRSFYLSKKMKPKSRRRKRRLRLWQLMMGPRITHQIWTPTFSQRSKFTTLKRHTQSKMTPGLDVKMRLNTLRSRSSTTFASSILLQITLSASIIRVTSTWPPCLITLAEPLAIWQKRPMTRATVQQDTLERSVNTRMQLNVTSTLHPQNSTKAAKMNTKTVNFTCTPYRDSTHATSSISTRKQI